MAEIVEIDEVFAMEVPAEIDPTNPLMVMVLLPKLNKLAGIYVMKQYVGLRQPDNLELDDIQWLITDDIADVEKFQPAHDCAACRAGNDQAMTFLRECPGRYIAMANIKYRETWNE